MSKARQLISLVEASGDILITTGVYAGAYLNQRLDTTLTHAVLLAQGKWTDSTLPLCRRAKNVMDDSTQWTKERPTCSVCAKRWEKMTKKDPSLLDWSEEQEFTPGGIADLDRM